MMQRRRGKNGAAQRYKGPRELVGARVPPALVEETDEARERHGATRNDWIAAALLVALDRPDEMRTALQRVEPPRRQMSFNSLEEVLVRTA